MADQPVREIQKEATRQRILDAALDEFGRLGYTSAELVCIARTAGITHAAIYRHFRSKLEIFRALLAVKRRGHAPDLLAVEDDPDPGHALYCFAVRWLAGFQADPDWSRLVRMCLLNEELYLTLSHDRDVYAADPGSGMNALVDRLVGRLHTDGRLRRGADPAREAAVFFNILKAVVSRRLLEFEAFPVPLTDDDAARAALGALLVGEIS